MLATSVVQRTGSARTQPRATVKSVQYVILSLQIFNVFGALGVHLAEALKTTLSFVVVLALNTG